MDRAIINFYSKPSQTGGALPYFVGERYNQIGGGFFSNIGRFLLPIAKTIGRELLGIGVSAANDVVNRKKKPVEALKNRSMKRARKFINKNQVSDDSQSS